VTTRMAWMEEQRNAKRAALVKALARLVYPLADRWVLRGQDYRDVTELVEPALTVAEWEKENGL
jgi:hypothetical protein